MTGDGNRLLPVLHARVNAWNRDRSTEHSTIHDATDSAIRTLPHLVEMIFVHTLGIWGNRSTLHGYTIFLGSLSRIDSHLIIGLVTVRQTKVIIL